MQDTSLILLNRTVNAIKMSETSSPAANIASEIQNAPDSCPREKISGEIKEWPGCKPDCMINRLRVVPRDQIGTNKRTFFSTYPQWEKMEPDKRDKSLSFFHNLSPVYINSITMTPSCHI